MGSMYLFVYIYFWLYHICPLLPWIEAFVIVCKFESRRLNVCVVFSLTRLNLIFLAYNLVVSSKNEPLLFFLQQEKQVKKKKVHFSNINNLYQMTQFMWKAVKIILHFRRTWKSSDSPVQQEQIGNTFI